VIGKKKIGREKGRGDGKVRGKKIMSREEQMERQEEERNNIRN
jgi:hypothetical protein